MIPPEYVPDLARVLHHFRTDNPGRVKARAVYDGTTPEVFLSRRVANALKAHDVEFRVNLAGVVVDSLADRLDVTSITVPDDEPADTALQTILTGNRWDLEGPEARRDTLVTGRGFLHVWPRPGATLRDDGTVDPADVQIVYHDPTTACVLKDEETRAPDLAARMFEEGDYTRVTLFYPDGRVARFRTKDTDAKGWHATEYDTYVEADEEWPAESGVPGLPLFPLATDLRDGTPVHARAFGPQDMLNKLVATAMSAVDFTGAPQRWALQDADAVSDVDDYFDDDDDDVATGGSSAKGTDRETPRLDSTPGSVWFLPRVKEVGEFTPVDPHAFLDPMDWVAKAMATVTAVPFHVMQAGGDQPSGESRRRAEAPLVKRALIIGAVMAAAEADAWVYALALAGFPDQAVTVEYADPSAADDMEFWGTVKAKQDAGVSVRQALIEAGRDPEQVTADLGEGTDTDLARRVALLQAMAIALKDLGTATTLGSVSEEQVSAVITALLPAVTAGGVGD
jgi:hypothetical protein